ncbi:MAG TPA: phosphoribosylamine--glycine ligase [Candidatus Paceibacterota bacterium]|nr:phosphoribosylamine--glycine ligase [Candidatus Paceibacterota bacterium]
MKRILVIDGGARGHAILHTLKATSSNGGVELFCAPGNGGISEIAKCCPVKADNLLGLLELAREIKPDLTVVGPEVPLVAGIADVFSESKFPVIGPSKAAAQLEGSKVFAKRFMWRHGIPTANARIFDNPAEAEKFVKAQKKPLVVKADGLCAGKGVTVANSAEEALAAVDEMMVRGKFGDAGRRVLIEEKLEGQECSFIVLSDGNSSVTLKPATDYKRRFDGDKGPNTGGMGCYSPVPAITPKMEKEVMEKIVEPTLYGMAEDGMPYCGFLYFGLMLTAEGPKVLEFNCRLGDPETSVILPLLRSDFSTMLFAAAAGTLNGMEISWHKKHAVGVVIAARNYPGKGVSGEFVYGLAEAGRNGALVFHAGTMKDDATGKIIANGGRILNAVGLGKSFEEARTAAYRTAHLIHFADRDFRNDIAANLK